MTSANILSSPNCMLGCVFAQNLGSEKKRRRWMCVTQLILRVKESMLLLVKVKRRESESECGSIADLGWCLRKDSSLKISGKGCECLISSDICPISIKTHPEWNEERVSDTWKEKWFSPKLTKSNTMRSLKQLLKQQKLCECVNGAICSPPSLLMCVTFFLFSLDDFGPNQIAQWSIRFISKIALVIRSI